MSTPETPATAPGTSFCGDDELGYRRSQTRFVPGEPLRMDEAYRLAHLPLIAPDHPAVISSRPGKDYLMGRHPPVLSAVAPVPAEALDGSKSYRELERELRASPFAAKIAWDVVQKRRAKLHATICGSLATGAPRVHDAIHRELRQVGPVHMELRGLFSGNVNVGRLYLRAYPERREGENMFQRIQRLFGRPETDLYVVGMFNLTDDLSAAETSALAAMIRRWWERPLAEIRLDRLWLLEARDDLVLDSAIAEELPLVSPPR